jgi:hypothetical protein
MPCACCAKECCGYVPANCTLTAEVVFSITGPVTFTYNPGTLEWESSEFNTNYGALPYDCQDEDQRSDPDWSNCCVSLSFADTPDLESCTEYAVTTWAKLLCRTCCISNGEDVGVNCDIVDAYTESYVNGTACNEPSSITFSLSCDSVECESGTFSLALSQGPGTQLKSMLSWFGFKPTPGCLCNKRARHMDRMGCDWCEKNLDTIVGWLREEHTRQRSFIPFVDAVVRRVVLTAIRKARKANSK